MYFFPNNDLSKKKHMIYLIMRKPHELNIRFYVASVTKLIDYLDVFLSYNPYKNRRNRDG